MGWLIYRTFYYDLVSLCTFSLTCSSSEVDCHCLVQCRRGCCQIKANKEASRAFMYNCLLSSWGHFLHNSNPRSSQVLFWACTWICICPFFQLLLSHFIYSTFPTFDGPHSCIPIDSLHTKSLSKTFLSVPIFLAHYFWARVVPV